MFVLLNDANCPRRQLVPQNTVIFARTVIGAARVHRNDRIQEGARFRKAKRRLLSFGGSRGARGCPFALSSVEEPNQRGLYANCGSGYLRLVHLNGWWKGSSSFLPWQRPAVSLNKTSLARNSSLCAPRG